MLQIVVCVLYLSLYLNTIRPSYLTTFYDLYDFCLTNTPIYPQTSTPQTLDILIHQNGESKWMTKFVELKADISRQLIFRVSSVHVSQVHSCLSVKSFQLYS
jgi:hypothetical protein